MTTRPANISEDAALLAPDYTLDAINDKISSVVLTPGLTRGWLLGFGIAFVLVMIFLYAVANLLVRGIGIWGINIPVGWGFDIVNFVWWIGIGHAGTLISAILLLFRSEWRTSINRFAEAMTLFAVACAGLFPILHLGRPQYFYWLVPYPANTGVWPQFRSRHLCGSGDGLARVGAPLVPSPEALLSASRSCNAAGSLSSQHREPRLRLWHYPRLALDDFPAVLRRWRDLFRLCNGAYARNSFAGRVWDAGLYHATTPGQHGEGYACQWTRGGIRLHDGNFHRVVQRQHL